MAIYTNRQNIIPMVSIRFQKPPVIIFFDNDTNTGYNMSNTFPINL